MWDLFRKLRTTPVMPVASLVGSWSCRWPLKQTSTKTPQKRTNVRQEVTSWVVSCPFLCQKQSTSLYEGSADVWFSSYLNDCWRLQTFSHSNHSFRNVIVLQDSHMTLQYAIVNASMRWAAMFLNEPTGCYFRSFAVKVVFIDIYAFQMIVTQSNSRTVSNHFGWVVLGRHKYWCLHHVGLNATTGRKNIYIKRGFWSVPD